VDAGPAYCILQWIHLYLGNFEQAISWQEPALLRLRPRFELRWYSWSLAGASAAYSWTGHCREAVIEAQKEISAAEDYHDTSLGTFAYFIASIAYACKGDFTKAIEHAEIAVEKAPTLADKIWAQTFLGFAWCRGGQSLKAADLLAALVPIYDATQFAAAQVLARAYLGESYWRAGQFDLAEQTLQKGLELASRFGMKFFAGSMYRLMGEVALARNPAQVAEPLAAPHFEAGISILSDIKAEAELACAYAGYGRLHGQQGRTTEAREYFARALAIFERLGILIEPDKVRSELAALAAPSR